MNRVKHGGRQKGTPNRTTIERAQRIEQAERQSGRRLAVERLAEAMDFWFGLAAKHQPGGPEPNPTLFKQYLKEGTTVARDLAPYQSPKLQSTTLRQDAPVEPIKVDIRFV